MEYYVNIKIEDSFNGTGFFGEKFSSFEKLKEILMKYLGENRAHAIMTFSFNTGSIIDEIKRRGDALSKKGQNIDLFIFAAALAKDPLSKYKIHYNPRHWVKDGRDFKFLLEENEELNIMFESKLSIILRNTLGMEI